MGRLARLALILVFLAACSSEGVPRVTPTVRPTNTPLNTAVALEPTRTPLLQFTDTAAPSDTATFTPTATFTLTYTPNPSETPTLTFTPTLTPTTTDTPTLTPTDTPNPSETPTPTLTPMPSSTPVPPTHTPNPSETPTLTFTPTLTPTDTPNPSETPTPTLTPMPSSTPVPPTDTPLPMPTPLPLIAPSQTPTATLTASNRPLEPSPDFTRIAESIWATQTAFFELQVPDPPTASPPTLDVTPTFVTADARTALPEDLGIFTPVPASITSEPEFILTNTPTPASTVAISIAIPATIAVVDVPVSPPVGNNTGPITFALTTDGSGDVTLGGFNLFDGSVLLFARNPVNPAQYVLTNTSGTLYVVDEGGAQRLNTSPFSEFEAFSPQENQYFVTEVEWAPDGRLLAYIIDGGQHSNPTNEDGVHFYNPATGQSTPLLRDAPYESHPGYQTGGTRDFLSRTESIAWSPQSDVILAQTRMTDDWADGQGVLFVLSLGQDASIQPPVLRYDYGSWTRGGDQIVVSGRRSDGLVIVGVVNRDGSGEQIVLNASSIGLWAQDAVQRPNGQFFALGRPEAEGGRNGPMRIYNQNGQAVTGDIGSAPPQRVDWAPDGSAVLVTADGRQYLASIKGTVQEITGRVGGGAVSWVRGGLPPGSAAPAASNNFVPSGVVEGSRFIPGQQLRVLSVDGLRMRNQPGLSGGQVSSVLPGEYVAILAGPVNLDNIEWWQVQNARGDVGWLAGEINGFSTLGE